MKATLILLICQVLILKNASSQETEHIKRYSISYETLFTYLISDHPVKSNINYNNIFSISPFVRLGFNVHSKGLKEKHTFNLGFSNLKVNHASNPIRYVDIYDTTSIRYYTLSQYYSGANFGYTFAKNVETNNTFKLYLGLGFNVMLLKLRRDAYTLFFDNKTESYFNTSRVGLVYTSYQVFGALDLEMKEKICRQKLRPNFKLFFGRNFSEIARSFDFQNNIKKRLFFHFLIGFNYEL